ncbi:DUF397 domain-containing protein [Streptomyces flaveolus]|uniref:DUF397 domain-containing protein n=1 Tax=Streptomyces flaveolus TaxID=67297 RepID=UPI00341250CC
MGGGDRVASRRSLPGGGIGASDLPPGHSVGGGECLLDLRRCGAPGRREHAPAPAEDLHKAHWRKSSCSGGANDCVEITDLGAHAAVHDSKNMNLPPAIASDQRVKPSPRSWSARPGLPPTSAD